MQGTVNGGRRRGRQKKRWDDNIREWTGLELRNTLRKAEDREEWKAVVGRSSAAPHRIPDLRDRLDPAWNFRMRIFSGSRSITSAHPATAKGNASEKTDAGNIR
ncbi:UDP-glucuronosyltransferase 2a1-like [Plakobranchus ocellatus]|uniref:UDP-glucuronosyltransferase 2a1-like n=1 Tax=Plakobranchus ocellatus TaxID=259542 RepID=A0AAV3ZIW4_9GAST|nr:UDP-glucuronosyltransferase 2a1-like [Plakobranchus ocellatus]